MNKKLHKWALEQFKDCVDRDGPLRERQTQERRFAALDQWPAHIRNQRENDPNGPRPCLTIDKTSQYRQQIVNEIRKNRPAVKVRPVDSAADPETAKIFGAHIRHIEDRSKAHIAYQNASEWAIDVGEGYFRFVTEYSDDGKTQNIVIKSIPNRFSVYPGRHFMPDGSDMKLCFVTEDIPVSSFRKQFPKAKYKTEDLEAAGDLANYWDAEDMVRVAELFYISESTTNVLVLDDDTEMGESEYWDSKDPRQIKDTKSEAKELVSWMKMTAVEILEENDFPSKYIPVVKIVGHERMVDGKIDRWGLMRPVMDPQRQYNYWASVLTENLGLTARSKWLMAAGQIEGYEKKWRESNTSTDPTLIYNPVDVMGQPVPAPARIPAGAPDVAVLRQLPLLEHDIQTALGMFKASVGDASSDQSGRAIRSLQSQSDTATFNFPDNVADSIAHGGRIMIDMIPRIKDVPSTLRLMGEDGKSTLAKIDPEQPFAKRDIRTATGVTSIYNLGVGEYDVTATVGPSYAAKRMEAAEFGQELIKTQPELIKIIGHIVFRNLDIEGADEIADVFEKMLPPQLQPPKDGQPPLPPQVIQQITQMQQQMQLMQEELQKEKAGTVEAQMKIQAQAKAEQQRIAMTDQNAKLQLQLQEQNQAESIRLAREKAEAEIALKTWVAQKDAELEEAKAVAAAKQTESKATFERDLKMRDIQQEDSQNVEKVTPHIMSALDEMLKRMEGGKLHGIKPIKDKMGNVIGGMATYANGETREISLQ